MRSLGPRTLPVLLLWVYRGQATRVAAQAVSVVKSPWRDGSLASGVELNLFCEDSAEKMDRSALFSR